MFRALINTQIGFLFRIYIDQAFSFQMTPLYGMIAIKNDQIRPELK